MKTRHFLLVVALLLAGLQTTTAQCKYRNTAVKPGEFLSYNLYYNWQFVWVKAGTASMSVVKSNYHGKPALRTGDIGFIADDGRLFWSSRKNSLIKVNGYRIEPGDVENHMCRIKGVTGCGVVERYGHLVAYVTLNREMTPAQVRAAARPHLPSHMIPGIVRIVDALPMTENGKLDRDRLE